MSRGLILLLFCWSSAYADGSTVRDWTIERPATAGILNGISVGLYDGFGFGEQSESASPYDPYGMTPMVYKELSRSGRLPYRVGSAVGYLLSLLVIFGVPFRRLNTLSATNELKTGIYRVAT